MSLFPDLFLTTLLGAGLRNFGHLVLMHCFRTAFALCSRSLVVFKPLLILAYKLSFRFRLFHAAFRLCISLNLFGIGSSVIFWPVVFTLGYFITAIPIFSKYFYSAES